MLPRPTAMGRFVGLRIDGRLAAMAGERMRSPGSVEGAQAPGLDQPPPRARISPTVAWYLSLIHI